MAFLLTDTTSTLEHARFGTIGLGMTSTVSADRNSRKKVTYPGWPQLKQSPPPPPPMRGWGQSRAKWPSSPQLSTSVSFSVCNPSGHLLATATVISSTFGSRSDFKAVANRGSIVMAAVILTSIPVASSNAYTTYTTSFLACGGEILVLRVLLYMVPHS